MSRFLTFLCVACLLTDCFTFAQSSKPLPQKPGAKSNAEQMSKADEERRFREERIQQLSSLREFLIARVIEDIKKTDEPAFRISARYELLKYLTTGKTPSDNDKILANRIAEDSLDDFDAHSTEIMPVLAEFLFASLDLWIKGYAPPLKEKLDALEKGAMKDAGGLSIMLQIQQPGGDVAAADTIKQKLEQQQDTSDLGYYLNSLINANSSQVDSILAKIVEVAARGQISLDSLLWVKEYYYRTQTPDEIKKAFAMMVVSRTLAPDVTTQTDSLTAYWLLTNSLPLIRQFVPEVYEQAVGQSQVLFASMGKDQAAAIDRRKRIEQDPLAIDGLLAQAEAATSKSHRNQLLIEAARLAFDRKKFSAGVDILGRFNLDSRDDSLSYLRSLDDSFISEMIGKLLAAKEPSLAEKTAGYIAAPYQRVVALLTVLRYPPMSNDRRTAARLFSDAIKSAEQVDDYIDKTLAYFLLGSNCDRVDCSQNASLMEVAVKALNDGTLPNQGANDPNPYQRAVWRQNGAALVLVIAIKDFTRKGEDPALLLIEKLARPETRVFGLLGVLEGVDVLLKCQTGNAKC